MTKKEFDGLKVGDFVDDLFNGIFRVTDISDNSEWFDKEEYNEWLEEGEEQAEEYKRKCGKYFTCEHVDYMVCNQ